MNKPVTSIITNLLDSLADIEARVKALRRLDTEIGGIRARSEDLDTLNILSTARDDIYNALEQNVEKLGYYIRYGIKGEIEKST